MRKLLIKYRFQGLPYIVADGKGVFYQLAHAGKKYNPFRKLNIILNNGVTRGYRINRNFISLHQLRKKSYITNEVLTIDNPADHLPF